MFILRQLSTAAAATAEALAWRRDDAGERAAL